MSYKHRGVLNSKEVPAETRDAVTSSALSGLAVLWKNQLKPKRRFAESCRLCRRSGWELLPAAAGTLPGNTQSPPPGGKRCERTPLIAATLPKRLSDTFPPAHAAFRFEFTLYPRLRQ